MSKILCIDQGNTRTKYAIVEDGKVLMTSYDRLGYPDIVQICEENNLDCVAIATVTEQLDIDILKGSVKVVRIDSQSKLPILNAYSTPETLGPDRLAMVVAAWDSFPDSPSVAISIGTCVTYNYIDAKGVFRGGAITPGAQMRLQALHHYTQALPDLKVERPYYTIGFDTDSSIWSGNFYGIVDEIDGMIARYADVAKSNINAILTGGDADLFVTALKSRIFVDDNLIFKGIYAIADYNL